MPSDQPAFSNLLWEVHAPQVSGGPWNTWDQIVEAGQYPAFMQSGFLSLAVEIFGCPGGRLLLGRRGQQFVAGALVAPIGMGRWSTFQPAQLPLGACVMTCDTSFHAVLPSMIRSLPRTAMSLAITQQDPDFVARPTTSRQIEVVDYITTGRVEVTGTFEQFWAARGKNLRQNLGKQQRRLEAQEGPIRFEFLDNPAEVDGAFLQFAELESRGWKGSEGTAVSLATAQGKFYRAALERLSSSGKGFAVRLWAGGRVVAVDLGVLNASSAVLLKTTYDESVKEYSPAQLLHQRAFEYFFQRTGISRIESYGRMLEWHTRWTEQSRSLFHVNFYRTPFVLSARNRLKAMQRLISST
jgi:hypothetical protein